MRLDIPAAPATGGCWCWAGPEDGDSSLRFARGGAAAADPGPTAMDS